LDELPTARTDEQLAKQKNAVVPPLEAQAAAAGATHNQPGVLTRPTIVSQKVAGDEERAASELSTDQEEREVFEL